MGSCTLYWYGTKGKLVCVGRKFGTKTQFTCVWENQNFAILNQTFRFLRKLLSVPKKSNSHQTTPFYETHNLLFTQIKLCLLIKNHKSLRSKITLLYRFKIFRAVELFDKTQTKRYQEIFMRICNRVQYSSEYIEPVQKGYFTA